MNLPFNTEDFLETFARYNEATKPAPFLLAALAALAVVGLARKWRHADRLASGVLGLFWFWSGLVYHILHFADINPAAVGFGIGFLGQAVEFFRRGVRHHQIVFDLRRTGFRTFAGVAVITYALVIYPLLGAALEHRWPHAPTFGAPCPIVLFTLGLFFWTGASFPKSMLLVPLAWTWVGTNAAIELGMYEDWALAVVGIGAGVSALMYPRFKADANQHSVPAGRLPHQNARRRARI